MHAVYAKAKPAILVPLTFPCFLYHSLSLSPCPPLLSILYVRLEHFEILRIIWKRNRRKITLKIYVKHFGTFERSMKLQDLYNIFIQIVQKYYQRHFDKNKYNKSSTFFFSFIFYLFSNSRTIYQEKRRRDNSLFIHCGDQPQTSRSGEVASSRNYAREQRFNEPVPCGPAPDFSGFVKSHVNARFIVHRPPFFFPKIWQGSMGTCCLRASTANFVARLRIAT